MGGFFCKEPLEAVKKVCLILGFKGGKHDGIVNELCP